MDLNWKDKKALFEGKELSRFKLELPNSLVLLVLEGMTLTPGDPYWTWELLMRNDPTDVKNAFRFWGGTLKEKEAERAKEEALQAARRWFRICLEGLGG